MNKSINKSINTKNNTKIEKKEDVNKKTSLKLNTLFCIMSMITIITLALTINVFNAYDYSLAKESIGMTRDEQTQTEPIETPGIEINYTYDATDLLNQTNYDVNFDSIISTLNQEKESKIQEILNQKNGSNGAANENVPSIDDLAEINSIDATMLLSTATTTLDGAVYEVKTLPFDALPDTDKMPTRTYFLTNHINYLFQKSTNPERSRIGYLYNLSMYTSTTYVFPKK